MSFSFFLEMYYKKYSCVGWGLMNGKIEIVEFFEVWTYNFKKISNLNLRFRTLPENFQT